MTGTEDLSYRKITENIAGKLDLLEAYLFYCLALWFQMSSKNH